MGHTAEQAPVEFAKRGITTVSEANRFLETEYRNFSIRGLPLSGSRVYFVSAAKI